MTPEQAIIALQSTPYEQGGSAWGGADCFGIVELWYEYVLGIIVEDRGSIGPGHSGIEKGVSSISEWSAIDVPEDHCLVLMRAGNFKYGHIGVYYGGSVLHSDERTGCVCEPITSRFLRSKISGYLRHNNMG